MLKLKKVKRERKMVKKSKVLTAVAALALGITAFASTNNSSAYYIVPSGADSVQVCHQMNGIINPVSTTFTYTVVPDDTNYNMSNVTVTGGTKDTTATTANFLKYTMDFNANSTTQQPICATLNFVPALSSNADWSETTFTISETASSDTQYEVDPNAQSLIIDYALNVGSNNEPIYNSQQSDYEATLTAKTLGNFETTVVTTKTHIELQKKVRGNLSDPNKQFDFSITLNKVNQQSSAPNTYHVYTSGGSAVATTPSPCNVGAACTFKMKHNDVIYIGYDGSQNELPEGSYTYTISETDLSDYNEFYVVNGGTETSGNATPSKTLADGDTVVFYNDKSDSLSGRFFVIFPFVLLAIIAAISIYAVRRSSAKKEQA